MGVEGFYLTEPHMFFDILLQDKYGCHMSLIDTTVKARDHFEYFFLNGTKFSGNIQRTRTVKYVIDGFGSVKWVDVS